MFLNVKFICIMIFFIYPYDIILLCTTLNCCIIFYSDFFLLNYQLPYFLKFYREIFDDKGINFKSSSNKDVLEIIEAHNEATKNIRISKIFITL